MIIDHTHPEYIKAWNSIGKSKWNGAYYYSIEIVENIIPHIKTDRNWITVNIDKAQIGCDHAIFIVHNHLHPKRYEWLKQYKDLIMVCSSYKDFPMAEQYGKPIYLPLSLDVEYVRSFATEKTKEIAYAGRKEKDKGVPKDIPRLYGMDRPHFLKELAKYKKVYAVDRVALEARILGCEVISDYGYPHFEPDEIIDTKDAIKILQAELDRIDGNGKRTEFATK